MLKFNVYTSGIKATLELDKHSTIDALTTITQMYQSVNIDGLDLIKTGWIYDGTDRHPLFSLVQETTPIVGPFKDFEFFELPNGDTVDKFVMFQCVSSDVELSSIYRIDDDCLTAVIVDPDIYSMSVIERHDDMVIVSCGYDDKHDITKAFVIEDNKLHTRTVVYNAVSGTYRLNTNGKTYQVDCDKCEFLEYGDTVVAKRNEKHDSLVSFGINTSNIHIIAADRQKLVYSHKGRLTVLLRNANNEFKKFINEGACNVIYISDNFLIMRPDGISLRIIDLNNIQRKHIEIECMDIEDIDITGDEAIVITRATTDKGARTSTYISRDRVEVVDRWSTTIHKEPKVDHIQDFTKGTPNTPDWVKIGIIIDKTADRCAVVEHSYIEDCLFEDIKVLKYSEIENALDFKVREISKPALNLIRETAKCLGGGIEDDFKFVKSVEPGYHTLNAGFISNK